MNYYLSVLMRYTVFSGRARRAEYWYFFLFNIIIIFVLHLIEGITGIASETYDSVLIVVYQLAVVTPHIAVDVRRIHDLNKSGWFFLIPVYNLILAVNDGTKGDNKYGPDPKEVKVSN